MSELKNIEQDVEEAAQDVEAVAGEVTSEVKTEAEKYAAELEGKGMQELMKLHDEAILLEDAAKRELHVLRQRAANMTTVVDDAVDKEIAAAKVKVAEAISWLHAIEKRLYGVPRGIWGDIYGRNTE